MDFNLYKAKVRCSGSLNNEVLKTELTAPEIALLQRIHGRDAVVDVVRVGAVKKRNDRSERHRLANTYPYGPSADGKSRLSGETFVDSVLGVGNVLAREYVAPVEADPVEIEAAEQEEIVLDSAEAAEPAEPIVRTRVAKKAAEPDPLAA